MTEAERQAYAREQRERCRPAECAHDPQCWVLWGGKGTLVPESMTKAVRCAACGGKLRCSEWREPPELALTPRAELWRGTKRSNSGSTFSRGLIFHIANTTLGEPRQRPSIGNVVGTTLVMLLAAALIVLIGMT